MDLDRAKRGKVTAVAMMQKALVIEDDPPIRNDLVEVLQSMGMGADQTGSADESVELLQNGNFDLVLLDLGLRDRSGSDLITLCRLLESPPIVVVVSSTMDISSRNQCLALGARDFISKPFHRGELARRIERALREGRPKPLARVGTLVLDDAAGMLHVGSVLMSLSMDEIDIMSLLIENPNRRFTTDDIAARSTRPGLVSRSRIRRTIRRLVRRFNHIAVSDAMDMHFSHQQLVLKINLA